MNPHRTFSRILMVPLALALLLALLLSAAAAGEAPIRIPFTVYGIDAARPFKAPRGLFCDHGQDEILVADPGSSRVIIFDGEGWPKYEFIHWIERDGERLQGEPCAVAVTPAGNIFLVDVLSPDLSILDFRGQPLNRLTPDELLPGEDEVTLSACLAAGPEGHIYAVGHSSGGHSLIEMMPSGEVVARVPLGQTDDLVQVTGLAVDAQRIYVSDLSAAACVQVFDRQGRRELAFGIHDAGWGNFSLPASIAVTSEGHMWVVDQIRQIVNHFDAEGHFLGFIGGSGFGPGSMKYPCAVATDRTDRVMVLEKVGRRLQAFVLPEGGGPAGKAGA